MQYRYHQLQNGIRIIYKYSNSSVSHIGVFINTGSRDELENEQGMAHFIEHMAFKGTTKRKAFHILNRLDNVGGDLNAFTTKEHTCLYASMLTEYTARAIELFSDIILRSTFPEKEMDKEKTIILDEINSYLDTPSESIFDDFEEQLFFPHPIARNILGTPDSIKKIRKSGVMRFINRNFTSSQTVISFIGKTPFNKFVSLSEQYFAEMEAKNIQRERFAFNGYKPKKKVLTKETHQTHVLTGTIAYSLDHPKKTGMYLLNNLLGGPGSNSRLNMALRERKGFTYHVESNYQPFSDTGYFNIYMGTTLPNPDATVEIAYKELKKLTASKLGTLQLHRAKKQLAGQIALGYESKQNEMLSIGKKLLNNIKVDPLETTIKKIDNITAEDIIDVANEILRPSQFSCLIYKSINTNDQ